MDDVIARIQPIFRDIFDNQKLVITRESSAETIAGWDSLAHINLISAIEDDMGVRFALGELADLKDVGDLVDLIEAKQRGT